MSAASRVVQRGPSGAEPIRELDVILLDESDCHAVSFAEL